MDLDLLVKVLQETVPAQSKMIAALRDGMDLQMESNAIQDKLIDAQNSQIKNLEAAMTVLKSKKIAPIVIFHHQEMKTV